MNLDLMAAQQSNANLKDQTSFLKTVDEVLKKLLDKGKLHEAVSYIAQGIKLRVDIYGEEAVEIFDYAKTYISKLCRLAILQFEETEPEQAIAIFKSIENLILSKFNQMSLKFGSIRVDLFNHLACCYRKIGKLKQTFAYLKKALDSSNYAIDKAQTYLNICSVQSQMDQHKEALENAFQAMHLVQEQLMQNNLENNYDKRSKHQINDEYQKQISILAVSYHNIGVEFEFLKNYAQSLEYYKKAVVIIETNAPNLPIAVNLKKAYESAQVSVQNKIKKNQIMQQKHSSKFRPKSAKAFVKAPKEMYFQPRKQQGNQPFNSQKN